MGSGVEAPIDFPDTVGANGVVDDSTIAKALAMLNTGKLALASQASDCDVLRSRSASGVYRLFLLLVMSSAISLPPLLCTLPFPSAISSSIPCSFRPS